MTPAYKMNNWRLVLVTWCVVASACQSTRPAPNPSPDDSSEEEESDAAGGSSSQMGGAGGGGSPSEECSQPVPLYLLVEASSQGGQGGQTNESEPEVIRSQEPSGIVACPGSRINVEEISACSPPLPVHQQFECEQIHRGLPEVCDSYVDKPNPDWCEGPECYVRVGCETDADCATGEACLCAASVETGTPATSIISRCIPAKCRTDADCGERQCGLSTPCREFPRYSLHCRTADDECGSDDDCDGGTCHFGDDGKWICGSPSCGD